MYPGFLEKLFSRGGKALWAWGLYRLMQLNLTPESEVFICRLIDLLLFLVWHLSYSIWNSSISGVESSWTSLYTARGKFALLLLLTCCDVDTVSVQLDPLQIIVRENTAALLQEHDSPFSPSSSLPHLRLLAYCVGISTPVLPESLMTH